MLQVFLKDLRTVHLKCNLPERRLGSLSPSLRERVADWLPSEQWANLRASRTFPLARPAFGSMQLSFLLTLFSLSVVYTEVFLVTFTKHLVYFLFYTLCPELTPPVFSQLTWNWAPTYGLNQPFDLLYRWFHVVALLLLLLLSHFSRVRLCATP